MKRLAYLFVGILFLVLLFLSGIWGILGQGVRGATLPLIRRIVPLSDRVDGAVTSKIHTPSQDELNSCESRLAKSVVDRSRLETLEEENKVLRTQAHLALTSGYDRVGALVIGRQIDKTRARLLIDRGTNDQLEIGQAVVTGEGIFIGRIIFVERSISTVELLTDISSRVTVALAKGDLLAGVAEGQGGGVAMLNYVPSSLSLAPDDMIVTAGTEEKIPARLPLGVITSLDRRPKDPFYQAILDPMVRFDRLSFVSILRPTALHADL